MKEETKAVHVGVYKDKQYNSVSTPIYTASTFYSTELDSPMEFDYTRSGNPTRRAFEENLAALEEGVDAVATSSGMSATTCTLFALLGTGDHLITCKEIYGGSHRLFAHIAPRMGIEVSFLEDLNNLEALKQTIKSNTRLIWLETPSNPLLKITDIAAVSKTVKAINPNIIVAADNTFMSPCFQKPLTLGCDIVMHSTTKYVGGHSDLIGGAIISKTEQLAKKVYSFANATGIAASPFDSWNGLKGLKTLPLRMKAHQQNAIKLATFLEKHLL
ncbi:MAG TPA: PLP-dependent transferase, partial [Vampirovibrionales bacterium]